ncbi:MAG: WYL domain-containing protein [Clostridia bacterium]|nr:WYL domain-containing protein [Clostridia bacterium]MBR2615642.1 WYL domain-containing protein [Clostridia bacterium]
MPRKSGQKRKLLYLAKFLLEETDEEHPATMQRMLDFLGAQGIEAERKSIYADLEELRTIGVDVICARGRTTGYFVGERSFQLPEVRLLVDAVQSSRFLTKKKSEELIGKLQGLVSRHQAKSITRQVLVAGRIKTMNESVYTAVDAIGSAMEKDCKIRFRYFEWDGEGNKKLRRNGALYTVSPYFLVWDDENYYLVALEENGEKRHFRVDKMLSVEESGERRDKSDAITPEDGADYEKKTFGMFGGRELRVTLSFHESLAGVFFDRFGRELVTRRTGDRLECSVPVAVSPMFYAWLMGFGNRVEVLGPEEVRREFVEMAEGILSVYREV